MTRGRFLLPLVVVAPLAGCVALLTGCGATPSVAASPRPAATVPGRVAVHAPDDVEAVLAGGRVTRTLVFDGGTLTLEPPGAAQPDLDEAGAIALARSRAPMGSASPVSVALVGLASASLSARVTFPPAVVAEPPQLSRRLVWMVLTTVGPHSCPPMRSVTGGPADPRPEPLQLALVAADGSGIGVAYDTAGEFCGRAVPASAAPLTYHVSLPWHVVRADAGTVTVAADVPACALGQGAMTSATAGGNPTVGIDAVVFMAPIGCRVTGPGSERVVTETVSRPGSAVPRHDATGLNPTGMIDHSSMTGFTYDDGTVHTIR